jgi:sulfatase maturation enzyme AslB (radical SAM superfamily)
VGLEGKLTIATNGALSEEQQDFLLAWFDGVNISFDGLPELQDRQRPFADGRGSFSAVDSTLRRLDAAGKHYGIRATLTADSVDRLADIAAFVAERYPHCEQLHIEPAWESGRCLQSGAHTPESARFTELFLTALRSLPEKGLRWSFPRPQRASDEHLLRSRPQFLCRDAEGLVTPATRCARCPIPGPGALYTVI